MDRLTEDLPPGAIPNFDFDRGQEVVFVTEDLEIRAWRAPYCGKKTLTVPKFRATEARLAELEKELLARCPLGSRTTVLKCSGESEDGTREWTAHVAIEHSAPMLAGD